MGKVKFDRQATTCQACLSLTEFCLFVSYSEIVTAYRVNPTVGSGIEEPVTACLLTAMKTDGRRNTWSATRITFVESYVVKLY